MPEPTRTLVLGDIHGAHRALVQVLERANFDPAADRIVFLGDVADGWPDTPACIDELLRIPNLVALRGNHDQWLLTWATGGSPGLVWMDQGGRATAVAYKRLGEVPAPHMRFLYHALPWYEADGRLYVHGGWPWYLYEHPRDCEYLVTWDRELWKAAWHREGARRTRPDVPARRTELEGVDEIYVGHTDTNRFGSAVPLRACEVWNVDTGAGWTGRLSLMDVETKEFWQSDRVPELYPDDAGRRGVR